MESQDNVTPNIQTNPQVQILTQKKKSRKYLWIIGGFIILLIGMMIGISLGHN